MKNTLFLISILFCFTSCKVVSIGEQKFKKMPSHPLLGTVGTFEEDILSTNFTETGVPELPEKIRLSVRKQMFRKGTLREYNEKVSIELEKLEIVDSLNLKPEFYLLHISDKVGLIEALNGVENQNLKTLLEATQDQVILTSMRIYFSPEIAALIDNASEVYLINNKKSSYSLELQNKDKTREIIEFSDGVSFGYDFSAFCWRENNRRQVEVVALRERGKSCPGETKKNPEKFRSKDLFEKL